MSMPPAPPPPCAVAVSHSECINQFEAPFADPVNRTKMTRTFFLFEPVLYQPSHLAQPVLTHIAFITKEYFVVAASTTERMIPCSLAQSVLKFKLTLEDVERELHGKGLSAGERIVWRRWVEEQNSREGRRSTVAASVKIEPRFARVKGSDLIFRRLRFLTPQNQMCLMRPLFCYPGGGVL